LQHIKTQVILTGNQGVVLIVSLILWPIAWVSLLQHFR